MPLYLLKKGQLQIGESIMVIIIILVIIMFALVHSFNATKEKYEIQTNSFNELDAIETAQIVTSLYELRCSKTGLEEICIDLYKAKALSELVQDKNFYPYYYNLFKQAKIILWEIYPEQLNYTIYEANASTKGQRKNSIMIPLIIHNATSDMTAFGILEVQRFHKLIGS